MVTRRMVIVGLVAAPIARALAAPKRRRRAPGRVYATAKSAAPLRVLDAAVFSRVNANDVYVAVAQLEKAPKDGPVLELASGEVRASSWGTGFGASGSTRGSASWELDRARADEVATLWRVARRDRVPLGAGLFGRWKPKGALVIGKPMPIVLTLENGGSAPVWFNVGGRQRGARDNRFRFGASRDGTALAVTDAPDFGGIGSVQPLEPGKSLERSEDLARWVTIDRPGSYEVTCRYELELTTGTDGGSWPAHGHEVWDWATDDVIDITVG